MPPDDIPLSTLPPDWKPNGDVPFPRLDMPTLSTLLQNPDLYQTASAFKPTLRDVLANQLIEHRVLRPDWTEGILGTQGLGQTAPPPSLTRGRMSDMTSFLDHPQDIVNPGHIGGAPFAGMLKAERFNWPVRTMYGKTVDMPITVNPSKSMIQRELAQHGDVRALRSPDGDVYLWPANEALHVDIADNFDLPFKTRQQLQQNSYLFNKGDVAQIGPFSNFDDMIKKLNAAAGD